MSDHQLFLIVWGPYVRIGCALDPIDRLAKVAQTPPPQRRGTPELIGTVPGGFGAESWLNAGLARQRTVGGWYHLTGPVADLVAAAERSGVEDLAPRARTPVRIRSGDAVFAVTSARGPVGERRRHAMLLPEATPAGLRLIHPQPALCGSGVSLVVAPYDVTDRRACSMCRRALPARRSS